jgi:hypothetical protein
MIIKLCQISQRIEIGNSHTIQERKLVSYQIWDFRTKQRMVRLRYTPGFTTFLKKEDKIYRVACDLFGPGDLFSPIWPMMDMLHHSDKEWHPKVSY